LIATVTLVLGEATFPVASQPLKQACGLFAAGGSPSRSRVQSRVPVGHFRLFLEVVKGNDIQIMSEKFQDCQNCAQSLAF
jgi:hypothetical protein